MYVAMGIGAAANLAIGLRPALLYDLLPFAVDYSPYAAAKVLEKSQLLVLTALAFWLLLDRLHAYPKVSLDVDWLYRALPGRLVATLAARPRASADGGTMTTLPALTVRRSSRFSALLAPDARADVVPTWTLGATILAAALVLLAVSLVP
jgi:multicomponent Na+:H+ antiporter subunit D